MAIAFRRELPTHEVKTTFQMGWALLRNGKLLAEAQHSFDVFLTVDKNIENEQNLENLPIPIIVLDVPMNTPEALRPFAPFVEIELSKLRPGKMLTIDVFGRIRIIAPGRVA